MQILVIKLLIKQKQQSRNALESGLSTQIEENSALVLSGLKQTPYSCFIQYTGLKMYINNMQVH